MEQGFGIYGILTDPFIGYERLTEVMVEKGLSYIQLRMKDKPKREVLSVAKALRTMIPSSIRFIVNDDPDIALESGADGVHLGQDDMDYEAARRVLGEGAAIGLSTHNPEQTREACERRPAYIGIGPVFSTPTKKKPDPVLGLDGMAEMLSLATVPAVVLGGIDLGNLGSVLAGGARNVCAVRCINQAKDPGSVIDRMRDIMDAHP